MNWTYVLENAALPEGQGLLMNNQHTESIRTFETKMDSGWVLIAL
jgi:hypothetical protein